MKFKNRKTRMVNTFLTNETSPREAIILRPLLIGFSFAYLVIQLDVGNMIFKYSGTTMKSSVRFIERAVLLN